MRRGFSKLEHALSTNISPALSRLNNLKEYPSKERETIRPSRTTGLQDAEEYIARFLHLSHSGHKLKWNFTLFISRKMETAAAQWLSCCATNRKVAGSIPASVIGFFIDIKSFRSHYGPGVDSASNRNEYQEYFLGVKAAGA